MDSDSRQLPVISENNETWSRGRELRDFDTHMNNEGQRDTSSNVPNKFA